MNPEQMKRLAELRQLVVTRKLAATHKEATQKLRIDTTHGLTIREVPKDPHGQVYDVYILSGPPALIPLAKTIATEFQKDLEGMTLGAAVAFMNTEFAKNTRRPMRPKWHGYSMPD